MSGEEWLYDPDELAAIDRWRPQHRASGTESGVAGLRRCSATGALVAAALIGLRDVLEARRDQVAVVVEAPGETSDPSAPVDVMFDPESPHATVAVVRR